MKKRIGKRARLEQDTYLALLRTHEALYARLQALFQAHGLTHPQYNVLRILRGAADHEGSCQYVAERLVTRVPDVTRLVDRMVAAGLVTRERSADDRRVVLVRLTRAGLELCDALDGPVAAADRANFAPLTTERLETLEGLLRELLEGAPG